MARKFPQTKNKHPGMQRAFGNNIMPSRHAHHFTPYRPGLLGDQEDEAREEMYIDCSPYFSLHGFGRQDSTEQRARHAAKNPRAPVDLGKNANNRSRGIDGDQHTAHDYAPDLYRGAPPANPSQSRWRTYTTGIPQGGYEPKIAGGSKRRNKTK